MQTCYILARGTCRHPHTLYLQPVHWLLYELHYHLVYLEKVKYMYMDCTVYSYCDLHRLWYALTIAKEYPLPFKHLKASIPTNWDTSTPYVAPILVALRALSSCMGIDFSIAASWSIKTAIKTFSISNWSIASLQLMIFMCVKTSHDTLPPCIN